MGHVCLLSSQRQSFVPLGQTPCTSSFVPFPFSLAAVSRVCLLILCTPFLWRNKSPLHQELVLGVLSRYFSSQWPHPHLMVGHGLGKRPQAGVRRGVWAHPRSGLASLCLPPRLMGPSHEQMHSRFRFSLIQDASFT